MTDEKEIKLKGWPAVLVIVGVLSFGIWRIFNAHADLESGATEKLKQWITAEYHRDALKHYENTPELLMEKMREIEKLEFEAIDARGTPDNMVVRVQVAPNPAEPAGAKHERYFRMQHDNLTGWHFKREVGVINWWMALWP